MNHPFKRIVPILLVIAIIASACWYFLVYDRDLARDLLLSQARYYESERRNDLATWFYDQAYIFAGNDEAVALELAQQYKSSGNYTKAEYTLSRAIADGGGVEVYIALCQTYVEQDKLMDAVQMLDNVADPAIKAQLEALRPAVPAVNMEPGYYTQYLTIEISADGGKLLASTDLEYPSVREDGYAAPIALPQGESTIYTLCVGSNGLVSPLGIYGYTIGGVIEAVTFADPAMEAAIREILGFDADTTIYTSDLWTITELTVPQEAKVYSDLSRLVYLNKLSITNGVAQELDCLASLTRLRNLFITGCTVDKQTMGLIAALPELERLTLANCGLSDISPLSAARDLNYLDLSYNAIGDLSPIGGMTQLEKLYLGHNALTDLSPIIGLSKLQLLNVSYNALATVAPLCSSPSLQNLNVSNNLLTTLGDIGNMTTLEILDASYNKLEDLGSLGSCTSLEELDLSHNAVTDIGSLATLAALRQFDFSYNAVSALPAWSKDLGLVQIDGSFNQITDLSPLRQLPVLNKVIMDYNPGLTSVQELAYCPNLIEVHIFGTLVTDVEILTKQSISVYYNPTEVEVTIDPTAESTEPAA